MGKHKQTVSELDAGQLDLMWQFLMLQKDKSCTKQDVRELELFLDKIRQAMMQKDAGQRRDGSPENVDFNDFGTYVNLAVVSAMTLYLRGGLDELERILPEESET